MFGRKKNQGSQKISFRSEDNSKCNLRDAVTVLFYEIYINNNVDILKGILSKHNIDPGNPYPEESITETSPWVIEELCKNYSCHHRN